MRRCIAPLWQAHQSGWRTHTLQIGNQTRFPSLTLGVREFYFTGGEPFMNRDLLPILEATLKQGPASVRDIAPRIAILDRGLDCR